MNKHLLYLALGSNLGDKQQNIGNAYKQIEKRIGEIISQSAFYITMPDGFQSDNMFVNSVCAVHTELSLTSILAITQRIELELGRDNKSRNNLYTDRIIDIDILIYDDLIINTPTLTVPHPRFHVRKFVMEPFAEIAPDVRHPMKGKTIKKLCEELPKSI